MLSIQWIGRRPRRHSRFGFDSHRHYLATAGAMRQMDFDQVPFVACEITIQVSCQSFKVWAWLLQRFTSSIRTYWNRALLSEVIGQHIDIRGARICMFIIQLDAQIKNPGLLHRCQVGTDALTVVGGVQHSLISARIECEGLSSKSVRHSLMAAC